VHRPRLSALACLLLGALLACKSKSEPTTTTTAATAALGTKPAAARADPLEVPRDLIWAASAHLRIIDVGAGQVVAGLNLQRAITGIAFTADGSRGFVAASDGVREVDVEQHRVLAQLTNHPARQVLLSDDGARLWVLEHQVIENPGGTREVLPFHLVTIGLKTGQIESDQELGQRILTIVPGSKDRQQLMLTESGELSLGGKTLGLEQGLPSAQGLQARPELVLSGDRVIAYVPVQGSPSRILVVDRVRGTVKPIALPRPMLLRGLALSPDGLRLAINTSQSLVTVELTSGKLTGEIDLAGAHSAIAMAADGRRVYLAQTVDGTGGAVTSVRLDPLKVEGKIHLDDISPWVLAVRPRAAYAGR
jgi:hypothetical protein